MFRFYESRYPSIHDLVMVQVTEVNDVASYVSLLEYGGLEGMITGDARLREGKVEVAKVIAIDEEKGHIDLTHKRLSVEEVKSCRERWVKSKWIHGVLSRIGQPLEELYPLVWPLYANGHAYDEIMANVDYLPEVLREPFRAAVEHRRKSDQVEVRADVDVWCWSESGIEAIRSALDLPDEVKVQLEASPRYMLSLTAPTKEAGDKRMGEICDMIRERIQASGGGFDIRIPIRVVS